MEQIISEIADFLRENGRTICLAWTASLLVIYGNFLAQFAKTIAKSWHFIFRVLFFMFVCGFGYGLLTVFLANVLIAQLKKLNDIGYISTIFCGFLVLGYLADQKRQI